MAKLTRSDFLKLTGAAVGASALGGRGLTALEPGTVLAPNGRPYPRLDQPADIILVSGKVVTMDSTDRIDAAVAVKDGLIQSTGTNSEIHALAGEQTTVIDLGGRTVTPGFIDPHCHFGLKSIFGTYLLPFLPPDVTSIAEMKSLVSELAAVTPEGEWILGFYLGLVEDREPDRWDLDAVAPNHPVWMMQQGGHWATANSRALEIAGITSDTADPTGGIIDRSDGGEPTGILYNHRAMDLVRIHIPPYTNDDLRTSILSTQALFAAVGVSGFHDNNIRALEAISTYQNLATSGQMYLRQALCYTLEWPGDLDRALNEVPHVNTDFTRLTGFKFLIDGQAPTFYCHEPHNGTSWDMPTWDPDTFKETVRVLHDTGLQICVHCGGDAAVDLALDAFEEAMNANPRPDPRHRLEHVVVTTPESTQRIKDLGVVVSTQPQFLYLGGDVYQEMLNPQQAERLIVTREWLDAGVRVALGSDTPTTAWHHPQATLYGAVSRVTYSGGTVGTEQAMTIGEALRAHTYEAAYAIHRENELGSLEPGKAADLVVWSADPYTISAEQVYHTLMDLTMINGEVVYLGPRSPRRRMGSG